MQQSNEASAPQLRHLCGRSQELQLCAHVLQLLRLAHPGACAPQERALQGGAHALQLENSPLSETRGKPAQQRRQSKR